MDILKTIVVCIIVGAVFLVVGFIGGCSYNKGQLDQRAIDTRNAIDQLASSNTNLRKLNSEFAESKRNLEQTVVRLASIAKSRQRTIDGLTDNYRKANDLIKQLREAIGGAGSTIQDIIGTVRRIREIIEKF